MSLRLRLALFGAAVVALTLVLFGALLYSLLARGVTSNQDDALRARARDAVSALAESPGVASRPPVVPADLKSSTDVFVVVMAQDGAVGYATATLNGAPPLAPAGLLAQARRRQGAFATQGSLRLYALPYTGGYVMTGQSTRVPQSNLAGIEVFLVISAIPALLAALLASWLVAGRALRPLKEMAREAEDVGRKRDFARKLPVPASRDEVALLASSFNQMLGQLRDAFDTQRRFVADASHELRTPLTTIQGNAGLLARGPEVSEEVRRAAAADIAEESARMARLVDRLLTLARADSGQTLQLTAVTLNEVVGEVCRQAAAVHPELKLTVNAGEALVKGDPDALRQLVWILLDNAYRYARNEIRVLLAVETAWARLTVADDGPGIPAQDRERVFERFYRADSARTGSHAGLGLSIARWLVEQHGGRIVAGESIGGGCAILVDLPLLRSS
ncbi:MAG: sensor histidine kinase [Candidatus Dormibacterales bacterium]